MIYVGCVNGFPALKALLLFHVAATLAMWQHEVPP